ncbi:hypothetical protein HDC37_000060 [Microbacterium sp. AK009]|uniref:hypothetical protein n=1 Tax=Microbacterium sp. AK009 TaxID=2723068 RepID=UPI0015CCBF71|nr:hypothetical protein [Microbacterium sp. AK009]NYF15248.1 hypothetical protein [Microbacterium sp. AK009]
MNESVFDEVVQAERLERWLTRSEPTGATANRLCLFERDGTWYTVVTDERAGVIETTRRSYRDRSEALADAVEGLRFLRDFLSSRT